MGICLWPDSWMDDRPPIWVVDMPSVEELREYKQWLEGEILRMLREFEDKFDVTVDSIELLQIYKTGEKAEVYSVEIKVLL